MLTRAGTIPLWGDERVEENLRATEKVEVKMEKNEVRIGRREGLVLPKLC